MSYPLPLLRGLQATDLAATSEQPGANALIFDNTGDEDVSLVYGDPSISPALSKIEFGHPFSVLPTVLFERKYEKLNVYLDIVPKSNASQQISASQFENLKANLDEFEIKNVELVETCPRNASADGKLVVCVGEASTKPILLGVSQRS
ncbi:hypothetical protein P43SY_007322 [Pythium insidiosum]|uniref:Uncharacterized protein n=1 Tax=Pythium insidiosum TaxID=114742 RepID=A0AAD5M1G2_PYTIN|nr:hypothetical protein P43SY_007322 [Pythium insidiosum]